MSLGHGGKGHTSVPLARVTSERKAMDHDRMAVGLDSIGAVRVDILWTPGKEGVELNLRDAETLVPYHIWEAPRLAIMPYTPEPGTLHSASRCILGSVPEPTFWTAYAYSLACRNGFTWVPEKLA
ncbi:hypothetical protein SEA_SUCCESS_80 [Streptomyces phage Success]|uniref:Uncharacterized protein n=1 Tax=Streptomyces phage Success TaxID=2999013 RepID=A0A9E8M5Z2_9CAUD|nr:hypothetical protein QEH47_gp52 [Streptomyces phage Success]WAB08859.1 hypothetical protein SEA_SUCCESS_80 [Streptomyces phage Success]